MKTIINFFKIKSNLKNKKKGFSFMDKIEQLKQQKQYEAYVKKKTPQHNVWFNMMKAFFLGGTICLIGQCI